jgi:hypothetical protein
MPPIGLDLITNPVSPHTPATTPTPTQSQYFSPRRAPRPSKWGWKTTTVTTQQLTPLKQSHTTPPQLLSPRRTRSYKPKKTPVPTTQLTPLPKNLSDCPTSCHNTTYPTFLTQLQQSILQTSTLSFLRASNAHVTLSPQPQHPAHTHPLHSHNSSNTCKHTEVTKCITSDPSSTIITSQNNAHSVTLPSPKLA